MIGVLQDILIDPDFVSMQSAFCLKNCGACVAFRSVGWSELNADDWVWRDAKPHVGNSTASLLLVTCRGV